MRRYTPAGHLIRRARREAGMTQRALSAATGVATSRISEYENGRRDPTVDTLLKLLAATGHTVKLADMADADFPNAHANNIRLMNVLDLVDALPARRPRRERHAVTEAARSRPSENAQGRAVTGASRRPFPELVLELHRSLDAAGVPHAFGGGLALAYCVVHPRATDDVDVNIAVPKEEALRVFGALPVGIRWGPRLVRLAELQGAAKLRWLQGVVVDLFFPTTEHHRLVQSRAEVQPFADTELPFVGATDLLVLKATCDRGRDVAGKQRDWTDIRLMLEAGTPDVDEALRWVERLEGPDGANLAKLRALVAEIAS